MAGAEPNAGVSSPLPLAGGSLWGVVPVPPTWSLRLAAAMFGDSPVGGSEDGDGVCPGEDVRARGPFRGLSVFLVSAGSVCAHVVGCCGLPASLDFAVCVSVCLWVKDVCARVLLVWRVCAAVGSVLVAWGCACVPTRLGVYCVRSVLAELCRQFSLSGLTVVSEGVCMCWCVCVVGLRAALGCFWGVSLWFPVAPRGHPSCLPTSLCIAASCKALLQEVN